MSGLIIGIGALVAAIAGFIGGYVFRNQENEYKLNEKELDRERWKQL